MPRDLRAHLVALHNLREAGKAANRRHPRRRLTTTQRDEVLRKTDRKCHICGGDIVEDWNADHVLAHSAGGEHSPANYLPAHTACNNYRWDYLPEEFQVILKLGVWARTQIEKATPLGRSIEREFTKAEARLITRRKKATTTDSV